MQPEPNLNTVPDDELLRRLGELVSQSRRVEADLVAHIGEVDARGLYARQAFPSMYAYCTEALHLSEAEAYRRITVARAARQHPQLLAMLRDGRLHLSSITLLAPLLTPENREALLQRATHRPKREIERLVAELQPRPDAPSLIRKLPQPRKAPLAGSSQETSGHEHPRAVETQASPPILCTLPDPPHHQRAPGSAAAIGPQQQGHRPAQEQPAHSRTGGRRAAGAERTFRAAGQSLLAVAGQSPGPRMTAHVTSGQPRPTSAPPPA